MPIKPTDLASGGHRDFYAKWHRRRMTKAGILSAKAKALIKKYGRAVGSTEKG